MRSQQPRGFWLRTIGKLRRPPRQRWSPERMAELRLLEADYHHRRRDLEHRWLVLRELTLEEWDRLDDENTAEFDRQMKEWAAA